MHQGSLKVIRQLRKIIMIGIKKYLTTIDIIYILIQYRFIHIYIYIYYIYIKSLFIIYI